MAPATAAARVDIQDALKAAGATHSSGSGAAGLRRTLVVAELAISLVLLIGAGLLAKSFLKLANTELGFPADHLLTFAVNLKGARYASGEGQVQYYDEALQRLARLPMVRSAAVATDVPLGNGIFSRMAFQVYGRPPLPMAQQPTADITYISAGFFSVLGIPLRNGRMFDPQDSPASPNGIIVNEALARSVFAGEDPIGRRLVTGPGSGQLTIVGVVGNVRASELGEPPRPMIYRCICQGGNRFLSRMKFILRTTGDPRNAIRDAEGQVYAVDRKQPVFEIKTMDQRLSDALAPQRFDLLLIGAFAAIAIMLAAAGVYGVMSYLVTRRTREMGIRIAMGAKPADVAALLIKESAVLAVVAVLIGLAGAWALTRYAKSLLYGISALDATTFAITPIVLAIIVIAASLGPAARASRIDPIRALREE
jgi:predicted permease